MLLVQCRESGELVDLDSYYMTASEVERMIEEALDERLGESKDIDEDWCHAIAKSGKRCSRNSERDGLCRLHWRMRESGWKLKTLPTQAEIEEKKARERAQREAAEARRNARIIEELRRQAVAREHEAQRQAVLRDFEENGHAAREAVERFVDKMMVLAERERDKINARYDSLAEEEIREAILEHGAMRDIARALGLARRNCHVGWLGHPNQDRGAVRKAHCERFRLDNVTKVNGVWVFSEPELVGSEEVNAKDASKFSRWLKDHHPELRKLVNTVRYEKASARRKADRDAH